MGTAVVPAGAAGASKVDRKSQRGDSSAAAAPAPTPNATLQRCVMMRGRWAGGSKLLMVLHNLESSLLGFMALLRSLSDRCAPTTQCALAFNGGSAAVSGAAPETAEPWAARCLRSSLCPQGSISASGGAWRFSWLQTAASSALASSVPKTFRWRSSQSKWPSQPICSEYTTKALRQFQTRQARWIRAAARCAQGRWGLNFSIALRLLHLRSAPGPQGPQGPRRRRCFRQWRCRICAAAVSTASRQPINSIGRAAVLR